MSYHVFLSHNSQDKPIVRALYDWLNRHGVKCFLDENDLEPGDVLTDALGEAMEESQSAIICIGPHGEGPWHGEEMNTLLSRSLRMARTSNEFRLIPVLLPEADTSQMRWFLQTRLWVDLSKGLTGAEAELERLRAAILGERGTPVVHDPGFNPYRGLEAFRREDAAAFFGREKESAELAAKLKQSRFCVISGASGSGKSSLARAGLGTDAALKVCPELPLWKQVTVKPGQGFLRALLLQLHANLPAHERGPLVESAIAALMPPSGLPSPEKWAEAVDQHLQNFFPDDDETVLLLVDQFEEIFTHRGIGSTTDKDRMDRARLVLDGLAMLRAEGSRRWRILITMRSDFYQRCRISPDFWGLLEKDHLTLELDELSEDGWREAIKSPASRAGAYLEAGLVEIMLKDVYRQRGSMPLLQLALQSLWQLRDGACLTHAAYTTIGGVANALQQRAESCLKTLGDESPELLQIARNLLLRLVSPGEGVSDTRRRADRRELEWENTAAADLDRVVNELTSPENRLLMTDGDSVEVVHEVLIRDCAKIRGWIELSRGELPILRRLTHSARSWEDSGREPVFLNPADPPRELKLWIKKTTLRVTPLEREFWKASRVERRQLHLDKRSARKRLKEEQEQRLKTVEAARVAAVLAEGKLRQRSRIAMAVAAVALSAAGTAVYLWKATVRQRDVAHRALADAFYHRLPGADPQLSSAEEDAMWELAALPPENDPVRALLIDKWLHGTGKIGRFAKYDLAALRSAGALRQLPNLAQRMAVKWLEDPQIHTLDLDTLVAIKSLPSTAFDAGFAGKVKNEILINGADVKEVDALFRILEALPTTALDAVFAREVLAKILKSILAAEIEAISGKLKALPITAPDAAAFAESVLQAVLTPNEKVWIGRVSRAETLSRVVQFLPPTAFDAAFAIKVLKAFLADAADIRQISALSNILKALPATALDAAFAREVLNAILTKATDANRIPCLSNFVKALPPKAFHTAFAGKVLEAFPAKATDKGQKSALSSILEALPATALDATFTRKVQEAIQTKATEPERISALSGVLKILPSTVLDVTFAGEVLSEILSEAKPSPRIKALFKVLDSLPSTALDAAFAEKVKKAILTKATDTDSIFALSRVLDAIPSTALDAAFAGMVLTQFLSEPKHSPRMGALSEVLNFLPSTALDATFAEKLKNAILTKATDTDRIVALSRVVDAIPSTALDAAFAEKLMNAILTKTTDSDRIDPLSRVPGGSYPEHVKTDLLTELEDGNRIRALSQVMDAIPSTALDAAFTEKTLETLTNGQVQNSRREALYDALVRATQAGDGFPTKLRLWALDHLLRKAYEAEKEECRRKQAVDLCSKLADTDPARLVDVLKWPVCHREGQKLVLEAIANAPRFKDKDVNFDGNLFTFAEKAPSLGFTNLDTPPERPTLEAAVAEWKKWKQ